MSGESYSVIDRMIDWGVAALFALACAYPAFMLAADRGQLALLLAGLCAILAFAAARKALNSLGGRRPRGAFDFVPAALPEPADLPPLELTEGPQAEVAALARTVLADREVPQGHEASVSDLNARIDRHLAQRGTAQRNDTAALADALERVRTRLA